MKVTVSYAQSVDGKIAVVNGESRYISESASLNLNQRMRGENEAILIGIGTLLQDDPLLTCRIEGLNNPVRVILDSALRTPDDSKIVKTAEEVPTFIFYDKEAGAAEDVSRLQKKGIGLIQTESAGTGRLAIDAVLLELEKIGITSVLVEGGAGIITSFLQAGLWDVLVIVTVGKLIGEGVSAVGDIGVTSIDNVLKPELQHIEVIGNEVVWTFKNDHAWQTGDADTGMTRSVVFTAPGEVMIRNDRLAGPGEPYTSRLIALSPGTERQFFLGNFSRGAASDPEIDCTDIDFEYPFPYGYINVVENAQGKRFFGFLPHSERFVLDGEGLIPIPDDIDDETALFIPHVETAISIIHDTGALYGDRILLTGAGVVGTLTARILRRLMGMDVTVLDSNPEKKLWFASGGFTTDAAAVLSSGGFDRAIEVSGNERALQTCIDSLVFEGTLTVASWYGERDIRINLGGAFHRKRLVLKSSQVSHMSPAIGSGWSKSRRMDKVLRILPNLEVADLLTHKFSFSSAKDAYTLLVNQKQLSGLVALIPGE